MRATYWTYQASSETPDYANVPDGAFRGTREQWESLSPGMRREIVRSFLKQRKESIA